MAKIEAKNVKKLYSGREVLHGVSFEVDGGEIYALLGPNGAGKTTLLGILSGALPPNSGEVRICGLNPKDPKAREKLGYSPQDLGLYGELKAIENVIGYGMLYGMSKREALSKGRRLLKEMGLSGFENKKVETFSGGMKRRLSFVICLLHDPEVLLLDEISSGLDPKGMIKVKEILREEKKEGKAILLATHYMAEAEELGDVVGIMDRGKIIAEGSPEELKRKCGLTSSIHLKGKFVPEEMRSLEGVLKATREEAIIVAKNPREKIPEITSFLYSKGMELTSLEVKEPTLEEVFISLTGRELE